MPRKIRFQVVCLKINVNKTFPTDKENAKIKKSKIQKYFKE